MIRTTWNVISVLLTTTLRHCAALQSGSRCRAFRAGEHLWCRICCSDLNNVVGARNAAVLRWRLLVQGRLLRREAWRCAKRPRLVLWHIAAIHPVPATNAAVCSLVGSELVHRAHLCISRIQNLTAWIALESVGPPSCLWNWSPQVASHARTAAAFASMRPVGCSLTSRRIACLCAQRGQRPFRHRDRAVGPLRPTSAACRGHLACAELSCARDGFADSLAPVDKSLIVQW